jgi:hypothetical protein
LTENHVVSSVTSGRLGHVNGTDQLGIGGVYLSSPGEFAIVHTRAQEGQCSNTTLFGSNLYLFLANAYGLLAVVDGVQLPRVIKISGCCGNLLMVGEHWLLLVLAVLQVVKNLVYWRFHTDMDPSIVPVVMGSLHYLSSSLFTFVFFGWAASYHRADSSLANTFKVGQSAGHATTYRDRDSTRQQRDTAVRRATAIHTNEHAVSATNSQRVNPLADSTPYCSGSSLASSA